MTTGVGKFSLTPIFDELQNSLFEDSKENVDIEDILNRPKWNYKDACARVQSKVEKALKGPRRDANGRFLKPVN